MNHEDHEDREDHDNREERDSKVSSVYRMRLHSPLTPQAERVMTATIGCAIRVHRELGPGFIESIYRKAMRVELEASGLSYEYERPVRAIS